MRHTLLSWIIPWWVVSIAWQVVGTPPLSLPSTQHGAQDLEILTYHIQSVVISRYAVTTVTCRIRNPALDAQEASFALLLPANAFISNLTIEAGGRNYTSLVREKEEARRTYEKAKSKGQNTAIVHQKERDTNRFRVDVSVTEQDEVIFYLTYEELLERRLGVYSHKVNVHPGYPVRDLLVDVTIHETRDISILEVKKVPGGHEFKDAVSEWREGAKTARVQYDPDPEMMTNDGLVHGQLEIHYDVERALDTGDVQIEDGYFVHFFAPVDLQYTPKHITFLIDTSGSMEGRKILQVKDALRHILTELNAGDTFNIIHFSDNTDRLGTMRYSGTAVRKAKKFINSLQARGGTNIDLGLKMALGRHRPPPQAHYHPNYVQACTVKGKSIGRKPNLSARPDALEHNLDHLATGTVRPHIVILLTDGQPTSGITQHSSILRNVRERNKDKAAVFSLGFGRGADMKLLERISIQNRGTSRKIYEDEDAADQLKGFYEELSMPILLDVRFSYSDDAVVLDSVTNTHFYNYFHGAELVVAGQTVAEQPSGLRANVTGQGRNGQFLMGVTDWNTVLPPDHHLLDHLHLAPTPRNFIKRLWAFQKVKDLLSIEKAAKGNHEKEIAKRKALRIALEHHFVTPLTSLVVVQPDKENCKDYEDDEEEEEEEEEDEHALAPYEEDEVDESGRVSVELDPHDSIVKVFNPKSIQVLRDQSDYYDTDVEAFNDFNYLNFGSMSLGKEQSGSEQLRMPCAMLILSVVFHTVVSQVFALGIQLPIK